jgi:hypothetical protein
MTLQRSFVIIFVLLSACSTPPTREISGQVTTAGAAVIAQSAAGRRFVAPLDARGAFRLSVPAGDVYRLVVAVRAPAGWAAVTRLKWPLAGAPLWARVSTGPTLRLGETFAPGPDIVDDGSSDGAPLPPAMCPVGEADLPYDVRLGVGDSFRLTDAFREKGPLPQAILSVTMEGGSWRLAELEADAAFTVTQADCDHAGNRDRGRDRVFVTWRNADGSSETDHLDLRYCDGGDSSGSSGTSSVALDSCEDDGAALCEPDEVHDSDCHGDSTGLSPVPAMDASLPACVSIF